MITLSTTELDAIQVDPIIAVTKVLDILESNGDTVIIPDPASPFIFALEYIAINNSVLRDELNTKYYRLHPRLANDDESLYNNMSYRDFINVFSQPSTNIFTFSINLTDLISVGVYNELNKYRMVSIPELSSIVVEGYIFLFTNRIDIKYFDNGNVSIEQNVSTTDIGVTDLGILPSTIIRSSSDNRQIIFETSLKQLDYLQNTYTIKASDSFNETIEYPNNLHFISAKIIQNSASRSIDIAYSEIIDPTKETIIIKILDGKIKATVPDVYIINGSMIGKLEITIFTTKGVVDYPLNRLPAESFKMAYTGTNTDAYTSVIGGLNISTTSNYRLTGGSNAKSFDELKTSVINNSVGDNNLPITSSQLTDRIERDGYYSYLLEDTITRRTYIISKTLVHSDDYTNAELDILVHKTTIQPSLYDDHTFISAETNTNDDKLLIKPYTLFKHGDTTTPLSQLEIDTFNNMTRVGKMTYLNDNKILFNPYSYISSLVNEVYNLRVIDFNNPEITNFNIVDINTTVLVKINIVGYSIVKNNNGYRIKINVAANSEFSTITSGLVRAQLRIGIENTEESIYYTASYVDGTFTFDIDTDFYVDENLLINITNGISTLSTRYINLNNTVEMITYIDDILHTEDTSTYYLNTGYVKTNETITAFTMETLDISFGKNIPELYRNITISYTDRKYMKYAADVPLLYDKIIYNTDHIGSLLTATSTTTVEYTILHNIGDPVLDKNGEIIMLHKAGDIMLDIDGNSIIDTNEGIVKYIDMLLLEYSATYIEEDLIGNALDSLSSWYTDITEYSESLLENTEIFYKPLKKNEMVKLNYNSSFLSVNNVIKPLVELFVETSIVISDSERTRLKNVIGSIIHNYTNQNIFYIVDLKEDIKEKISFDVSAVRIRLDRTNVENVLNNMEKFTLYDKNNRLYLDKYITDQLGVNILVYDVEVRITQI